MKGQYKPTRKICSSLLENLFNFDKVLFWCQFHFWQSFCFSMFHVQDQHEVTCTIWSSQHQNWESYNQLCVLATTLFLWRYCFAIFLVKCQFELPYDIWISFIENWIKYDQFCILVAISFFDFLCGRSILTTMLNLDILLCKVSVIWSNFEKYRNPSHTWLAQD